MYNVVDFCESYIIFYAILCLDFALYLVKGMSDVSGALSTSVFR